MADTMQTLIERRAEELTAEVVKRRFHHVTEVNPLLSALREDIRQALLILASEATEEAAKVAENGHFLHDDAPDARFGKACATAIRLSATTGKKE